MRAGGQAGGGLGVCGRGGRERESARAATAAARNETRSLLRASPAVAHAFSALLISLFGGAGALSAAPVRKADGVVGQRIPIESAE